MERILYVNACMRSPSVSRTEKLAEAFLSGYHFDSVEEIREIMLRHSSLLPLTEEDINRRDTLVAHCDYSDPLFDEAKAFAEADLILIAAPFWDCSFPAALKVYAEHISCEGLTFQSTAAGLLPMCRFHDMVYLSTIGGQPIDGIHHGEAYWRSMCTFLGEGRFHCLSVRELDIEGRDADALMRIGCEKARLLGEELSRRTT